MKYHRTYPVGSLIVGQCPRIWSYMRYRSSANYGKHTLVVSYKGIDFFYSYETLVAFSSDAGMVAHKNIWGRTTGKHLNRIIQEQSNPGLPLRANQSKEEFAVQLYNLVKAKGLIKGDWAPSAVQAIESGEIINANIPKEKANTPRLAELKRQQKELKRQQKEDEERKEADKKKKLEERRQRRREKEWEKKQRQLLRDMITDGFPNMELVEGML